MTDFGEYYNDSFINNTADHLPKCWDGWFELRIREETESIDGVEVRKFDLDPDLDFFIESQPASFEFYCYIAFIDNHRLVFYTPYRTTMKDINKQFDLYNPKQSDFQRGYYLYKHPSKQDTSGLLEVLLENRKRKRKTELIFEVQFKKDSGRNTEVACLKLIQMNGPNETHLDAKSPKSKREYKAADLLSFQPTYYFEGRRSLGLFTKDKTNGSAVSDSIHVDSIFLNAANRERLYYYEEKLQFKEKLSGNGVRDTLRSW